MYNWQKDDPSCKDWEEITVETGMPNGMVWEEQDSPVNWETHDMYPKPWCGFTPEDLCYHRVFLLEVNGLWLVRCKSINLEEGFRPAGRKSNTAPTYREVDLAKVTTAVPKPYEQKDNEKLANSSRTQMNGDNSSLECCNVDRNKSWWKTFNEGTKWVTVGKHFI